MNRRAAALASYATYDVLIQYTRYCFASVSFIWGRRRISFNIYSRPHTIYFLLRLLRCTLNYLTRTDFLVGAPYLRPHVHFTGCTLFCFIRFTTLRGVVRIVCLYNLFPSPSIRGWSTDCTLCRSISTYCVQWLSRPG